MASVVSVVKIRKKLSLIWFTSICLFSSLDCKIYNREQRDSIHSFSSEYLNDPLYFHKIHHMQRRSAADDKLKTTTTVLPGSADAFIRVWWSQKGSSTIYAMTIPHKHSRTHGSGLLFRSQDYGKTFSTITVGGDAIPINIYPSKLNSHKVIAIDRGYKKIHVTKDAGNSWKTYTVSFDIYYITYHPTIDDYLLSYDGRLMMLWVSTDFGATWTLIHKRASYPYFWAVDGVDKDNTTVHFEYQDRRGLTYYKACAHPYCKDVTIAKASGEIEPMSLHVSNNYIMVQRPRTNLLSDMYVSYKRGPLLQAMLPNNLHPDDAEVLNTDDDLVLISATDGKEFNLYVSDVTGRYYVASLPNVYATVSAFYNYVDLYEVKGSRGTFIVNQFTASKQIITRITYNKGVNWVPIVAPEDGCSISSDCSLHFHLYAKMYTLGTYLMMSAAEAPGLLFMHGSSGKSLDRKSLSAYRSRDGGITWKKLFAGVHDFNILDHGGAIVAITNPRSNHTRDILYSCTEGDTWETHTFTSSPMHVYSVLREPGMATLVVNIYGKHSRTSKWTVIHADFSSLLSRKCATSDYEDWSPTAIYSHSEKVGKCILGSNYTFHRRKSHSQCFNGRNYDSAFRNAKCTCTDVDFQCAYGYKTQDSDCIEETWYDSAILSRNCAEGEQYIVYKGFRKIAGDTCSGGVGNKADHKTTSKNCPVIRPQQMTLTPYYPIVATLR